MNDLVARAVRHCGSQAELARRLGCTQQLISAMLRGTRRVTGDRALAIDTATGGNVSAVQLRPDLFGQRGDGSIIPAQRDACATDALTARQDEAAA